MDVDLEQLPIPDWGLRCPTCEYLLKGLPTHRCPECGTALDIQALIRTWTRLRDPWFYGTELPIPDFGLECPGCGRDLAGLGAYSCPDCEADVTPALAAPRREWFLLEKWLCGRFTAPELEILFGNELVPYMSSDEQTVFEIHLGGGPIGGRLRVPTEFYYDVLWLLRREHRRAPSENPDRTCPSCGEQNPGDFVTCWNCGGELVDG